jgi:hypothetical protein
LIGELHLKGFHKPVPAFELVSSRWTPDETTCAAIDGKAE